MSNLNTSLGKLKLNNPIICSSGCFGHGYELKEYTDLKLLGAVVLKTVTIEPRIGNPPPRIKEVSCGMLSSIGLQNPGIDIFVRDVMPKVIETLDSNQIIVSIAGNTVEEYARMCKIISNTYENNISSIEINAACPNVEFGGGAFCGNPVAMKELICSVKQVTSLPIITKINTNYDNTSVVAKAIEEAGSDAICTTSTPIGMAIDIFKRRPVLGNVKGPISGPAIRPIGVSKVWDIYNAVKIPIIGGGGIYTTEDALEYIMAGATAVGIGSAHFSNPRSSVEILDGLEKFLEKYNITNISDIIGIAHI